MCFNFGESDTLVLFHRSIHFIICVFCSNLVTTCSKHVITTVLSKTIQCSKNKNKIHIQNYKEILFSLAHTRFVDASRSLLLQ